MVRSFMFKFSSINSSAHFTELSCSSWIEIEGALGDAYSYLFLINWAMNPSWNKVELTLTA